MEFAVSSGRFQRPLYRFHILHNIYVQIGFIFYWRAVQWNWLALYFLKWNTAISDIFFFNPTFPKFFSIRFSLGGGRHISCHVELYTKVIDLKNPSKWSKGKHSWVWILNLWVQISETPTIFPMKKKICNRDSNTQALNPKWALLVPRPWIHEKCL